jgi:hypothetical protein
MGALIADLRLPGPALGSRCHIFHRISGGIGGVGDGGALFALQHALQHYSGPNVSIFVVFRAQEKFGFSEFSGARHLENLPRTFCRLFHFSHSLSPHRASQIRRMRAMAARRAPRPRCLGCALDF